MGQFLCHSRATSEYSLDGPGQNPFLTKSLTTDTNNILHELLKGLWKNNRVNGIDEICLLFINIIVVQWNASMSLYKTFKKIIQ